MSPKAWLWNKAVGWLTRPAAADVLSPNDFDCVLDRIRPADVLLIEGRTRIGEIIKIITRSSWNHSGLCIGRLRDVRDAATAALVRRHYSGDMQ